LIRSKEKSTIMLKSCFF